VYIGFGLKTGCDMYDRVAHLETAYDVWLKLCNTLRSSLRVEILITDNTRFSLRTLERP
jgi:hypothetical protein